jgi:hypothetical protein
MGQDGGVVSRIAGWAKTPFSESMDWKGWILFLGLVVIVVAAWLQVLKHIEEI